MKRFLQTALLLCLLFLLPAPAFAAGSGRYALDDLGMSIELPEEYIVLTRDMPSDDPDLRACGLTKEEMLPLLESNNMYLNAWGPDADFEIMVTMVDSMLTDFNQLNDAALSVLAASFGPDYEKRGFSFLKSDTYQHAQTKFIKIYFSQPNDGGTSHALQYYTEYDGKTINIILQSYSDKIDSYKEGILKDIVDSARFDAEPVQPAAAAPAFTYTDSDTGITFTVPANWTQEPLNKEREFIKVKLASAAEKGLFIMYGSTDLWETLAPGERTGYTRADIDHSIFTKTIAAQMLGVPEKDISMATYAGKEYYKAQVDSKSSFNGTDISIIMTVLVHVENGYVYSFQFSDASGNRHYKDFESLLNSVSYPGAAAKGAAAPDLRIGPFFVGLLLTILLHPLPIYLYRHAIRKSAVEPKKAKVITILDAIAVLIIMLAITRAGDGSRISVAAILLWSGISYSILTKGYQKSDTPQGAAMAAGATGLENNADNAAADIGVSSNKNVYPPENAVPGQQSPTHQDAAKDAAGINPAAFEPRFCHKCGNPLAQGDAFCSRCGTQIPR